MNVLDEDIPEGQVLQLKSWRIRARQIGAEVGRCGMKDDAIITMLLQMRRPTFFSRDEGFFDRTLCHARYSLVYLDVDKSEVAVFIRRLLRHPSLHSQTTRMGAVVRVSGGGVTIWRLHAEQSARLKW